MDGWPMIVVESTKNGWDVKEKKSPKSASKKRSGHKTKKEAVKKGRNLAKRERGTLRIKYKTGKIQTTRRYGD